MASIHVISKGQLRMRLSESAGQAVAVYPAFRNVLKLSATAAQMLSQALYWTERTQDGWFYKTENEWLEEVGLSAKEVRTARKRLKEVDLIQEVRKGVPAKMYFRVDVDALMDYLDGRKSITSCAHQGELVVPKGQRKSSPKVTTITEITQETTAETTTDTLPALPADAGKPVAELVEVKAEALKQLKPAKPVFEQDGPRCEIPDDMPGPKDPNCKTYRAWANYAFAYRNRYGVWPVWNAAAGGMLGKLINQLGAEEAPKVAAFYLSVNDSRPINDCHSLNILIAKASAYRTQWATGRQMNSRTARQIEDTQANINAAEEAARRIMSKGESNEFL